MAIASINPATGERLAEFAELTAAEVESKLAAAEGAFQQHRRSSFAERAEKMTRAAELLEAEKDLLARTITLEMGKLLTASRDEIGKCARACRSYAENAERL